MQMIKYQPIQSVKKKGLRMYYRWALYFLLSLFLTVSSYSLLVWQGGELPTRDLMKKNFSASSTTSSEQLIANKITSWVGNTWGGIYDRVPSREDTTSYRKGAVQMNIEAIGVAPDGIVYTNANWDESHKVTGYYSGDDTGSVIDHGMLWKNINVPRWEDGQWYWVHPDGGAAAVNHKYVFLSVKSNYDIDGKRGQKDGYIRRYNRETRNPDGLDIDVNGDGSTRYPIQGLAIYGNEVFASDYINNKIKVYDIKTLTKIREFNFNKPKRLTADSNGNLWIIEDEEQPRIRKFSSTGKNLNVAITFTPGVAPVDVAYNSVLGRVMVADNGSDRNIKFYDPHNISGSPANISGTLGADGGIYSGIRGEYAPKKFMHLTGVDSDRSGNIYISMSKSKPGASIESYKPNGAFRWAIYNHGWIEVAVPNPEDDRQVYTSTKRYQMNYEKSISNNQAHEWSYKAHTLDEYRYPDDPREQNSNTTLLAVRTIDSQKFLYMTNMYSKWLAIFRFNRATDGEIAIPCGMISSGSSKVESYPPNRSQDAEYVWSDRNGDGQFDTTEYVYNSIRSPDDAWGWHVDTSGDIWLASKTNGLYAYRYQGKNTNGCPAYDFSHRDNHPMPSLFNQLRRVIYDDQNGKLYLAGYSSSFPNFDNIWGKAAGRVLAQYSWDGTSSIPTPNWKIDNLVYKPGTKKHTDLFISSIDVAGDYVFLQRSHNENPGTGQRDTQYCEVYHVSDGSHVGYLKPGDNASIEFAQIDVPYGLRAHKRADGEYLIFVEDDWFGKVLMYRWNPASVKGSDTKSDWQK